MYWTCEILGSFEKLFFFLRMTHSHCCRTFMAMCAPRVIPTSLPAWHVLTEICVSERVWSSASPGGGWDRTHQKVHAIASRGHGLSAWVWRGKWLNYEILKMSVAIFFCLPLNMFSIFFRVLFRWIQWQGRGWPGQAERRGWHRSPRAWVDGGGTHHGAKTTTSTEYPVPPRCLSTWTVQSMQRGTKFDQFVVWRSVWNEFLVGLKFLLKIDGRRCSKVTKGYKKESWWMCILRTSISKPPLATPWLDRV